MCVLARFHLTCNVPSHNIIIRYVSFDCHIGLKDNIGHSLTYNVPSYIE
jgi:hypothetical protein